MTGGPMTVEDQYFELRQEIRELAVTMVRLEQVAKEARDLRRYKRVAEMDKARAAVRDRRTALLHEVWLIRQDRY